MPDIQQMLINLSQSYPALWKLITAISYVTGFLLAYRALYHLKVYGELRTMMASQASLRTPVTYLVIAAIFTFFPVGVQVIVVTLWGSETPLSPLGYNSSGGATGDMALDAILGFIQLVGLIAFVRGWMMIAGSSQHGTQQNNARGFIHVIGGIMAINIVGTRNVIWATFGFSSTWNP